MKITFKKRPTRQGLTRLAESYSVKQDGCEVARIQRSGDSWFWYGDGVNTAHSPVPLAECKAQVKRHFKEGESLDRLYEKICGKNKSMSESQ